MKVVVAAGSGASGRRLCTDLSGRGHDVVVLTRRPRPGPFREVGWDGAGIGPWASELEGSTVVNLAGQLVDRRPTRANIDLLVRSRVDPTRALAIAAARLDAPVPVWVQVVLRTSIDLDRGSPALDRLSALVRCGIGGRVGSGRQWSPWIQINDWLRIVRWSLEDGGSTEPAPRAGDTSGPSSTCLQGVVLATSPNPVRNHELMRTLRDLLHRPPAPPHARSRRQAGIDPASHRPGPRPDRAPRRPRPTDGGPDAV